MIYVCVCVCVCVYICIYSVCVCTYTISSIIYIYIYIYIDDTVYIYIYIYIYILPINKRMHNVAACLYATIFMEKFENTYIYTDTYNDCLFYTIFTDDIFLTLTGRKEQVNYFQINLNMTLSNLIAKNQCSQLHF